MYIAPGQGQTTPWGQMLMSKEKSLSLCTFVASFKMISSKSHFIQIFNDFIHVHIAPGQGRIQPLGDKLLMSTESPYHFAHSLQV